MVRRIITIILCLGVAFTALRAQEYSPVYLQGIFGGGASFHTASFTQLPGIPNCCAEFGSAIGMSLNIGIGAEYDTKATLFGSPLHLGVLGYYQLSNAALTEQEEVGNIINGQTVTDGIVEHSIDLTYGAVYLEPYVAIPLPVIKRLYLSVGAGVGTSLSATVNQQQTLFEPTDPNYTFENGSRTRNEYVGDLPDKAPLQVAVTIGLRYDVQMGEPWHIVPTLRYSYGLTSIMSSTPWDINSLQGGVMLQYHLSKPAPPTKPDTVPVRHTPPPVVIRVEKALSGSLTLAALDVTARTHDDTVDVAIITETVDERVAQITPAIFFEVNSTDPKPMSVTPEEVIAHIQSIMEQNPRARITVVGSASFDEAPELARMRVTWLTDRLKADNNRVGVRTTVATSSRYQQLDEENRSVSFTIEGVNLPLWTKNSTVKRQADDVVLIATNVLTCEAGPCVSTITASVEESTARVRSSTIKETTQLTIPGDAFPFGSARRVSATAITSDSLGKSISSTAFIVVQPITKQRTVHSVMLNTFGEIDSTFLIGLFEFDGTEFTFIDNIVVDLIRQHISRGGSVELLPGTDNMGTPEYNKSLQQKRAERALHVLRITDRSKIGTVYTQSTATSNATPLGRTSNRSVRARLLAP